MNGAGNRRSIGSGWLYQPKVRLPGCLKRPFLDRLKDEHMRRLRTPITGAPDQQ
jgi:hypothetical protein